MREIGTSNDLDLLRELSRRNGVPDIKLAAMAQEDDKVLAFQLGADEYAQHARRYAHSASERVHR